MAVAIMVIIWCVLNRWGKNCCYKNDTMDNNNVQIEMPTVVPTPVRLGNLTIPTPASQQPPQTCPTGCPRHAQDDAPDGAPYDAPDDAPDMPQIMPKMMPQTCPR